MLTFYQNIKKKSREYFHKTLTIFCLYGIIYVLKTERGKFMAEKKAEFLTFKGKPLVRMGNMIYYGNPGDKYVVMLQILSTEDFGGFNLARKVSVQLQLTDPEVKAVDRIVKRADKVGLYQAMVIADIWLERALSEDSVAE